ncbi:sushi, nidogen and EGF-like domain-containing protein 1 [Ditylenchus destructor]|nr:sushi, nidogen and EGF-like domain-containing protein 1 [Ditylenchus destructor]
MLRILFIWWPLIICGAYAVVPLDKFFLFGSQHGDQKLNWNVVWNKNARSGRIYVDPAFTIFGKLRDWVDVYDDGFMEILSGSIFIFSGNVKVRGQLGDVYWRKTNSTVDLEKARQEIALAYPAYPNLDLKWALIATWYNVYPLSPSSYSGDAKAGFVIDNTENKYWISDSGTPEILTIAHRSNVGSPGKFIFRIDQRNISDPSSLCAIPPQPENGFCKAEEFIPGSLATCLCKIGYRMDTIDIYPLKCSYFVWNKKYEWMGEMPVCTPLTAITQGDKTSCPITNCPNPAPLPISSHGQVKTCPPPPVPQNGTCEQKSYLVGSLANCACLPNYKNINPNSYLYCVFAEDGTDVVWAGGMPVCESTAPKSFWDKLTIYWPSPPTPQNGICENKSYVGGLFANCSCLPNYRNVNPNTYLYAGYDENNNRVWSGGIPICVNSTA